MEKELHNVYSSQNIIMVIRSRTCRKHLGHKKSIHSFSPKTQKEEKTWVTKL